MVLQPGTTVPTSPEHKLWWAMPGTYVDTGESNDRIRQHVTIVYECVLVVNSLLATIAAAGFFNPLPCALHASDEECSGVEAVDAPLWTLCFVLHSCVAWMCFVVIAAFHILPSHSNTTYGLPTLAQYMLSPSGYTLYIFPFTVGTTAMAALLAATAVRSIAWLTKSMAVANTVIVCIGYLGRHHDVVFPARQVVCHTQDGASHGDAQGPVPRHVQVPARRCHAVLLPAPPTRKFRFRC